MAKFGGRSSIPEVLALMQRLYQGWAEDFDWRKSDPLSMTPSSTDPSLLNGVALARSGRIPAVELSKRDASLTYLVAGAGTEDCTVAIVSHAKAVPLDTDSARAGIAILRGRAEDVEALLLESDILFLDEGNASPQLKLSSYKKIFDNIAYIERARCKSLEGERSLFPPSCALHAGYDSAPHVQTTSAHSASWSTSEP